MDAAEQAKTLLQAVAEADSFEEHLHPRLSFRNDRGEHLDRDDLVERLHRRLEGSHGHRFVFGDAMAKRNVVFASWEWQAPDGQTIESGTWFMSFDRDGRVREWSEIAAGQAQDG